MPQWQDSQAAMSQGGRSALFGLWLTFVLLLGLPAGVALAAHQYSLVFQPASGAPGENGEGLIELMEPGTAVFLHWTSCRGPLLAKGTVGPEGSLTLPFVVPENTPPGDVEIWVCDTELFEDEAWGFTVTATEPETGPDLELSQDAGIPGSVVEVRGTGFGGGEWEVRLGDDLVIGSALAGSDGVLEGSGTIPLDTAEGATTMSACRFDVDVGSECYGAPFQVTPPSLNIDPTEFHPADTFGVSGAGWCCGNETGTVVDTADRVEWGTVAVDDSGALEGLVTVPPDAQSGETLLEICVRQCLRVPVTVLAVVVSTVEGTVPTTVPSTIVETTIIPEESGCAIVPESLAVTPATGVAGTAIEISLTSATDSSAGCRFSAAMAGRQVTDPFDLGPGIGLVLVGVIPEGVAIGPNTLEIVDVASQAVVAATVFEIEGGGPSWVVLAAVTVVAVFLIGLLVRAVRRRLGEGLHSEEQEPPVAVPVSPRTTATIRMPADVEAGRPFQLAVLLEPEPEHRLPELAIDVGLLGDGYDHDDTVRQRITTGSEGGAFVVFGLTARPVEATGRHRVIAHLSQGGHLVGWAQAEPLVHPQGTILTGSGLAPATTMPLGTPDGPPPDLTLIITRGDDQRYLLWGFESPHTISLPTVQVRSDLEKANARAFAHDEVLALASTAPELVGMQLRGVATQIGGRVPAAAWQTVRDVAPYAASAGRPPVILIVSEETYVPWELAAVPDDLALDPAAPALLGAQTVIGRWMPPDLGDGLQADHPRLPPSATIEVDSMAVVVHTVGDSAAPVLPYAGQEADILASTYGAFTVPAATGPVAGLLELRHKVEGEVAVPSVLHLTCHGAVDPNHPSRSGVVLMAVEGSWVPLTPAMLRGSPLLPTAQPLVFINACATGTPQEALDGFGGLVGAALKSGARAVVAPLWKVDDRPARDVALAVYQETLGGSEVMGAAFRGVRAEATRSEGVDRSFLAYVFFGHPMLRMVRASTPVTVADVAEMATG